MSTTQTHFSLIGFRLRLTYQRELWLWADSWTPAASPGTWNPSQDLPVKQEADSRQLRFWLFLFRGRANRSLTAGLTAVWLWTGRPFSAPGVCVDGWACRVASPQPGSYAHTHTELWQAKRSFHRRSRRDVSSSPGEDVFEELEGSSLQEGFLLCDGVGVVGQLLFQLLQLLQVLANLLQTLRHCREPAGGPNAEDPGSRRLMVRGTSRGLTSSAAGPRRRWADRRCRRSAAVASTPAAPRWSGRPVGRGWR